MNTAYTRQSTPDSGLGFQVKVLETFDCFPSSLDSGGGRTGHVLESGGKVTRQQVFRNVEVRADRPVTRSLIRVEGLGFWVEDLGSGVQSLGFRV